MVLNLMLDNRLELETPITASEGDERLLENNTRRIWTLSAKYKLYNPLE
jgi:hypothetical protein